MTTRSKRVTVGVPAAVILLAAAIRIWGIAQPTQLYWDEQYYVFDAEVYLGGGIGQPVGNPPPVKIADEGTWVHPPLGKWIIALLGVGPMGLRSFGWRLPSVVFGIAGVGLLYFLALELWGSVWWAGLASLLLALDGLHIVQSRIAMLDIFMTTFVTAGVLLLVLDRRRMRDPRAAFRRRAMIERVFGSWYRLGAGAALGAAVATKWSGAFALVLGAALCTTWALTSERSGSTRIATFGTVAASFVLVPLVVYLISYGAFFYQHGFAVRDFLTLQLRMFQYQQGHLRVQKENSLPWTWPLLLHPIQYFSLARGGSSSKIVALGNPVLWWGFLALLPVAAITVLRRPVWQEALAFGGYAAMFLPWLAIRRSQFIFYMLPAVPFMSLSVAATLRRLPPRAGRVLGVAFAAIVIVAAVAYLPAWTGWRVPEGWLDGLRLLPHWPL